MRAYVILGEIDDPECNPDILGVMSSKKAAIQACERYLESQTDVGSVTWNYKQKHNGWAKKGDYIALYQMFFINRDYQDATS